MVRAFTGKCRGGGIRRRRIRPVISVSSRAARLSAALLVLLGLTVSRRSEAQLLAAEGDDRPPPDRRGLDRGSAQPPGRHRERRQGADPGARRRERDRDPAGGDPAPRLALARGGALERPRPLRDRRRGDPLGRRARRHRRAAGRHPDHEGDDQRGRGELPPRPHRVPRARVHPARDRRAGRDREGAALRPLRRERLPRDGERDHRAAREGAQVAGRGAGLLRPRQGAASAARRCSATARSPPGC